MTGKKIGPGPHARPGTDGHQSPVFVVRRDGLRTRISCSWRGASGARCLDLGSCPALMREQADAVFSALVAAWREGGLCAIARVRESLGIGASS